MNMHEFENKLPEGGLIKPYRIEVLADNSGVWAGNGMRYASVTEASAAARDLFNRWTSCREWRVMSDTDEVMVRS